MVTDEILMKTLIRTGAHIRRRPASVPEFDENGNPCPESHDQNSRHKPEGRGFGHILELLIPGEGVSQQWIANQAGIRAQSVSEAILAMEKRGFVRREPSEADRRVMLIYITEEGKVYRQKAAEERSRRARTFFSCLTQEEKEELFRILEKLIPAAPEHPAAPQNEQEAL